MTEIKYVLLSGRSVAPSFTLFMTLSRFVIGCIILDALIKVVYYQTCDDLGITLR